MHTVSEVIEKARCLSKEIGQSKLTKAIEELADVADRRCPELPVPEVPDLRESEPELCLARPWDNTSSAIRHQLALLASIQGPQAYSEFTQAKNRLFFCFALIAEKVHQMDAQFGVVQGTLSLPAE